MELINFSWDFHLRNSSCFKTKFFLWVKKKIKAKIAKNRSQRIRAFWKKPVKAKFQKFCFEDWLFFSNRHQIERIFPFFTEIFSKILLENPSRPFFSFGFLRMNPISPERQKKSASKFSFFGTFYQPKD